MEAIAASEASGSYIQLTQMGVYYVSQQVEEVKKVQSFAAGFPVVSESAVTPADQMLAENGQADTLEKKAGILEIRRYILILLLLLLLAEWVVYLRLK